MYLLKTSEEKKVKKMYIREGFLSDGSKVSNIVVDCVKDVTYIYSSLVANTNYKGTFDTRGVVGIKQRANLSIFFKTKSDFSTTIPENMDIVYESAKPSVKYSTNQLDSSYTVNSLPEKSDEELTEEIQEKFYILNLMSQATINNTVRSLVVSGSPGTGKSFGVLKLIEKKKKEDDSFVAIELKGTVSPIMLFATLYQCKDKNSILLLDDCDAIVEDVETLNMVKAATDSSSKRFISYTKLSSYLEEQGIPNTFEFCGSVIYLSNINFAKEMERKSKLAPHIAAFVSRSHYIDVSLETNREKLIRILTVVNSKEFEIEHNISSDDVKELVDYIKENCESFRELSIRLVAKMVDLKKSFASDWQRIARVTLCI